MSLLVASLVADQEPWLHRFLNQIELLDYHNIAKSENHKIRYAFLEGPSNDQTWSILEPWTKSHNAWSKRTGLKIKNRFERLATLRNMLIQEALQDEIYVLMIDSDLVQIPTTLIESLMKHRVAVVAPAVYIEDSRQFYDTLSFRMISNHKLPAWNIPFKGLVELSSVGACCLIEAKYFRDGCKYTGDDSEHVGFCKQVRNHGGKVYADFNIEVSHANLPKYHRLWH